MKYLIIGLIGLITVSCASLKINVDVHKGDLPPLTGPSTHNALNVMNSNWFRTETRNIAFETLLNDLKNKYLQITISKYKRVLPKQKAYKGKTPGEITTIATELAKSDWLKEEDGKKTGLSVLIREEWEKYDAGAKDVYDKARFSYQLSSSILGTTLKGEALKAFREFQGAYEFYMLALNPELFFNALSLLLIQKEFEKDDLDKVAGLSELKDLVKTIPGIAASELVKGKQVGYPIFDPRIPDISRDDADWDNFNSTDFSSGLGKAQFVAVREGLLVFHKKGLDFDPTPIVGAGAATAKLGIKVAGAVAAGTTGIPLNLLTSGKESDTSSPSSGQQEFVIKEADIASMKADIENRTQARKKMLFELGYLLEKLEKKQITVADNALKEYQRIIYFYLGQLSLTEE